MLSADFFTSQTLLLTQLNWQSVSQRVNYQFSMYMFKVINGRVPNYLHDIIVFKVPLIFTRHAIACPLYIPKPKTDYMKRSFQYQGSVIWNNLPQCVRNSTWIMSFKRKYKLLSIDFSQSLKVNVL